MLRPGGDAGPFFMPVLRPEHDFLPAIIQRNHTLETSRKSIEKEFVTYIHRYGLRDDVFITAHRLLHLAGFGYLSHAKQMEKLTKLAFDMRKPKNKNSGDGIACCGHVIEIKMSCIFPDYRLTRVNHDYNFSHIRLWQPVTHYLLHMFNDAEDWMRWYLIPSEQFHDIMEFSGLTCSVGMRREENVQNKLSERQLIIIPNSSAHQALMERMSPYIVSTPELNRVLRAPAPGTIGEMLCS